MIEKKFLTSNQKEIDVFDEVFSLKEKKQLFGFMKTSMFRFLGESKDTEFLEKNIFKPYLQSLYSESDFQSLKFVNDNVTSIIQNKLDGYRIDKAYVYVSDHTTVHHFHIDNSHKTMLYYPMIEWKPEYGGETMFSNEELTEIEYTSLYKPGRIILFDSDIPHKMSAPASTCPYYRFTFVVNWKK